MLTWLKIWAVPFGALVAWYGLSAHDINFGTRFLSREMHDEFFRFYTSILGVEKDQLPAMLGKAVLVDGSFIGAFIAYRKRKTLKPWMARKTAPLMSRVTAFLFPASSNDQAPIEE